jgi:transcriptional regulator of acetoin/glycerol metabolism
MEGFTQKALELLTSYHWPGNIRELRNVIERAVVISRGRMIGASELTFLNPRAQTLPSGGTTLSDQEINLIKAALDACNGNIIRASKQLGINRSTLMRKMKRYQLARSTT